MTDPYAWHDAALRGAADPTLEPQPGWYALGPCSAVEIFQDRTCVVLDGAVCAHCDETETRRVWPAALGRPISAAAFEARELAATSTIEADG